MKAILIDHPGEPEVLRLAEVLDPVAGPRDVLMRVAGAGVNRADLLQRRGFYPPPPGASEVLGMEAAGEVVATGVDVSEWRVGDRVMALVEGGAYAELLRAPAGQVMAAPRQMDLVTAAGIPEVFITAHDALFTHGRLRTGETVLIHGGGGGVGTAAVQLTCRGGARVIVTAGSTAKLERARELGAEWGIDYTTDDFVARVREITDGQGADVILDVMGAAYLERNINALAPDGRLLVIGLQGGTTAEIDLGKLMRIRGSVISTALRARPAHQKAAIVSDFVEHVLPAFDEGSLCPVIGRVFPLEAAAEAHRALENGEVIGKVILQVAA
jgi:putative PIG3 family NAD(P)H quinone oxidoreductase